MMTAPLSSRSLCDLQRLHPVPRPFGRMQFYGAEPQQVLTVLAAADGHAKDPYAVRRVCTELSRLVLADSKLRLQMIADELLLPTLVAAVAEHVDEQALLLADCCRFLRRTISLRGEVSACVAA